MKYLCLEYNDAMQVNPHSQEEFDQLRQSGYLIVEGRFPRNVAVTTLCFEKDNLCLVDGSRLQPATQIAGFVVIEAKDLNEAIRVIAQMPPAHGGSIEVRPIEINYR